LLNENALGNAVRQFLMGLDEDENDGEECMPEEGKEERTQLSNRDVDHLLYI